MEAFEINKPGIVEFDFFAGSISHDPYSGTYLVIPSFSRQVLNTANKTLSRDVVIEPIPVSMVTNIKGGKTATIG